MRLCYFCGVSPYDLFTMQPSKLNFDRLKVRSLPDIPNPTRNRRHRVQLDIAHLRQSLEAILVCEEQPPPSMRAVARRLNHSPRELREYFPELCCAISNRHKIYNRARGKKNLNSRKTKSARQYLKLSLKAYIQVHTGLVCS